MFAQREMRRSLLVVLCAVMLTCSLLSTVHAQTTEIVVDGEAACTDLAGVWDEPQTRCDVANIVVDTTSFSVAETVTVAISETLINGDLRVTVLLPHVWSASFFSGTTTVSGTLMTLREGANYDRLTNTGLLWIEGDFANRYAVSGHCERLPPYPGWCSVTRHFAHLLNSGRMVILGRLRNDATLENRSTLVVADAAGGTIPPAPRHVDAASLSALEVHETAAQLVNAGVIRNAGVIENLGTIYMTADMAGSLGPDRAGIFVNDGRCDNHGALALDVGTQIQNAGTISNTGVIVLDGMLRNGGRIVGGGAIVNRGELINVGHVDGLLFNEGRIVNAGTIDGPIVGSGVVIELTEREYLPVAAVP